MALTQQQKQSLLADPAFQKLIGKSPTPVLDTPTPTISPAPIASTPQLSVRQPQAQPSLSVAEPIASPQLAVSKAPIQPQLNVRTSFKEKAKMFREQGGAEQIKKEPGFLDRIKEQLKQRGAGLGETFGQTASGEISPVETGLRTVGDVIGIGADIVGETLISGIKLIPGTEELGGAVLKTERGQAGLQKIGEGLESYQAWKAESTTNNRIGEVIESLIDISEVFGAGFVTKRGAKTVVKSVEKRAAKTLVKSADEIDTLVGRITQGTKEEILKAKSALKKVDTTGVKTFEDLKNLSGDNISGLARKQDELLDAIAPEPHKLSSFTKKVGSKEQNFVQRSIDQLKELYDKTEDLTKLDEIEILEAKFIKDGITAKEVNALARQYGSDMTTNAFSKRTGEALTSVNAVAFENTRKGVKEAARSVLPDDASKLLDAEITDLFTVKRLAQKMENTVQNLQNKVKKRGLIEKVARKAGQVVDIATFGTVRGFTNAFIGSNVGNKVLNSLDIEEALLKNLKRIDKLTGTIDKLSDADAVSALVKILKEIAK